jgi:predicted DNA-binding transcriptional regulator AlpA
MNLLPTKEVMSRLGGVSQMTIWRYLKDDELDFPKPIYIKTRRYWREDDLEAWLETRH